jgi:hypothetical protein
MSNWREESEVNVRKLLTNAVPLKQPSNKQIEDSYLHHKYTIKCLVALYKINHYSHLTPSYRFQNSNSRESTT